MKRAVRQWELAGTIFIVLVGSALHFVFAWSGYWRPVAAIALVNESVWEHLKLAFWPGRAFASIEDAALRKRANNYWVAKSVGLFSMPALIAVLFYVYMVAAFSLLSYYPPRLPLLRDSVTGQYGLLDAYPVSH